MPMELKGMPQLATAVAVMNILVPMAEASPNFAEINRVSGTPIEQFYCTKGEVTQLLEVIHTGTFVQVQAVIDAAPTPECYNDLMFVKASAKTDAIENVVKNNFNQSGLYDFYLSAKEELSLVGKAHNEAVPHLLERLEDIEVPVLKLSLEGAFVDLEVLIEMPIVGESDQNWLDIANVDMFTQVRAQIMINSITNEIDVLESASVDVSKQKARLLDNRLWLAAGRINALLVPPAQFRQPLDD